jgi:hypothetical protein
MMASRALLSPDFRPLRESDHVLCDLILSNAIKTVLQRFKNRLREESNDRFDHFNSISLHAALFLINREVQEPERKIRLLLVRP